MKVTAYAATMQAVWFSADLGESWSRPPTPTGGMYNEARCWAVSSHIDAPGQFLAGTDQGLYRWTHEQQRWNYIPSPMDDLQILQLAQSPSDPDFIVCGTRPAEIFLSEDGGESWRRSALNAATECWFINTTRITSIQFDPADADTIWITIEIDGVFRSRDRGKTWDHLINGLRDNDTHNLVFLNDSNPRTILCSTEAGLHKSVDEGACWEYIDIPLAPWLYFRSIESKPGDTNILLASVGDKPSGVTGVLLISHDAGATWDNAVLDQPVNSTIWWIGTNSADPDLMFFCTIFGQIYRSRNGGDSWQKMQRELGEIRMIGWAPTPE